MNEKELINEILKGDIEKYSYFIKEYQNEIYNLCFSIVKNRDDALDLTQEAFLIAFKNLKNFRGEASFSTWIYRIAYNLSINFAKRKGQILTILDRDEDEIEFQIEDKKSSIWDEIEREERIKIINKCLNRLKEFDRLIIELREVNNLTYEEMSQILSLPIGTIKSRLFRARERLKREIEKEFMKKDNESETNF
ncbi:MAG: sigma-70 family RNA polymerase sigma factor [Caldisericia bacterium]|jgi:RNA polymerase sigma-70 factor (ECF subfamily)|nr:sigma-70 family RNA polymerase sigma factor [Caldisericia bacterium]